MEEATEKKSEVKTEFFNILQILAIISLSAGLFIALKVLTDYHKADELAAALYAAAGVFSGAFWWALAVIVKAATKYLNSEK